MTPIIFQLQVPIGPKWAHVELLRTSVLNCLATVFQSRDYCQSVSMVAGELLENAVKYGDWSRPDRQLFQLRVEGDAGRVRVEVCNPVVRDSREVHALLNAVQQIARASTAEAAYRQRLSEIAEGSQRGSGLGLVRVVYEGDCSLEAEVNEDGVLRVQAVATT